ncbi:hypothetical protein YC2023_093710 [Brassica napus]
MTNPDPPYSSGYAGRPAGQQSSSRLGTCVTCKKEGRELRPGKRKSIPNKRHELNNSGHASRSTVQRRRRRCFVVVDHSIEEEETQRARIAIVITCSPFSSIIGKSPKRQTRKL